MPRTSVGKVALALLTACGAPAVLAVQADVGFNLGAEYSDNITLAPSGSEEEAWVEVAAANVRVVERSAEDDLRVQGALQYRNYQGGDFDDEFLLSLDARGIWTLSPGRLKWYLEDYFDQATVDVFSPPTPENRQDTNVLSTGPEARFRLSESQSAIAGARYGNFYFEESEVDSFRLSGYGRWVYAMTSRRDLSANVEVTRVEYLDKGFDDYRRGDLFLRITNRWARATVELDAGKSAIERDRVEDVDGFLGRLEWNHDFNSYSGLDAYLVHQYTDEGHDILDTAARDGAIGTLDEQLTGDVFYVRHSELGYRWQGVRTSWRIGGALRDEDFEVVANDRRYEEATMRFGYELTATLRTAITGLYRRWEFLEVNQVDTERNAALELDYQVNTRLAAALEIQHNERDSNVPVAAFTENRILLYVAYDRGPGPEPVQAEEY